MTTNKIALIQVWLGPIPDYFEYHFESIKNLKNIDFIFFTDQDLKFKSENLKVEYINKDLLQNLFYEKTNVKLNLNQQTYKVCDLKASYGHLFEDFLLNYSFFGFYDIDTIFGDVNHFINPYLFDFDIISFGGKEYHDRISGPFTILKNVPELKTAYYSEEFFSMLKNREVVCYEEEYFFHNVVKNKFKYKILTDVCGFVEKDGFYQEYNSIWKSGKLYVGGVEKMILHFYHKKNIDFIKQNDLIKTFTKNKILNDFYWVTYCTENYEELLLNLLKSIKNYSNRKIIVFTINYDFDLNKHIYYDNSQFEFIKYKMERGDKDERGRDFNIMCFKPKICSEVIKKLPNQKFIYIDTDIHFTTNSDNLGKFLEKIEHYPLLNSHIHDVIFTSGLVEDEDWSDSIQLIMNESKIDQPRLYPRRKANVICFDRNNDWFFKEQIKLFDFMKSINKLHLLKIYDEDLANVILTKYGLTKVLPLVDIEENYEISLDNLKNYSYSMTSISPNVQLPQNTNEIYFFHGFKKNEDYEKINQNYGSSVLKKDDILINYENRTILFQKNNFLIGKKINNLVRFVVENKHGNFITELGDQRIFDYSLFYISDVNLMSGNYILKIIEQDSQKLIYSNFFEVK